MLFHIRLFKLLYFKDFPIFIPDPIFLDTESDTSGKAGGL